MLLGKRILVIDDETLFAGNLRDYFSRRGAQVMLLESGEEAIEGTGYFSPDVVIIADRLPAMGGAETCRALKAVLPHFCAILLTDRARSLSSLAAESGVEWVVEKPFPLSELERLVTAGCTARVGAGPWHGALPGRRAADSSFDPRPGGGLPREDRLQRATGF